MDRRLFYSTVVQCLRIFFPVFVFPGQPLTHAHLGDEDVPSLYAALELLLATNPPRAEGTVHPVLHVARVRKNETRLLSRAPTRRDVLPSGQQKTEKVYIIHMSFGAYSAYQRLGAFQAKKSNW